MTGSRADRFGPADWVTLARAVLAVGAAAFVAGSFDHPVRVAVLVSLASVALALDALDGWVARRTRTAGGFGARFDGEVDAFLILALSVYVARSSGAWVLTIGVARYAFGAAGWVLPWMREPLPPRYWRKVVTAACGIALAVVASQLLSPTGDLLVAGAALVLVLESFGRDVLWLARLNRTAPTLVSLEKASTTSPHEESR
jgi:phosphatidylglycerophosphate synthase